MEPHVEGVDCSKAEERDPMSCSNNCELRALVIDEADQEVDVTGSTDKGSFPTCADDPDATEYSSSFGDTDSDSEGGMQQDCSDMEADSHFNGASSVFNGYNRVFKKKRVTDHWRRFIRPLMWRCRWIELRLNELNSQASKYDRKLAIYNKEKQLRVEMLSPGINAAREIALTFPNQIKTMKRRKRKRSEDTVDISSYMSHHTVFSYYEKKPEPDGLLIDEGGAEQSNLTSDDFGINSVWPMRNIKEEDSLLEQILLNIDSVQFRVLELKNQLNKLFTDYAGEIFSNPGMFIPGDPQYCSSLSPRCSPVNNGETAPSEPVNTPTYASEDENEDMVFPGSAVSSFGDADIIENAGDFFTSSIGLPRSRHQAGNNTEVVLINNQAPCEELGDLENTSHLAEKSQQMNKEEEDESFTRKVSSSETETDVDIAPVVARPHSISRRGPSLDVHLRRSKRKRKLKRASPGSWHGEKRRRRKLTK